LATSVLPRLAMDNLVEDPGTGFGDDTAVRLKPGIWSHLGPASAEARDALIGAAAVGMTPHGAARASTMETVVVDGSRLEGQHLTKAYGGRTGVNKVDGECLAGRA